MMPLGRRVFATRVVTSTVGSLMAGALVSGCAVGPNFRRPGAPAVDCYARPSLSSTTTSSVDVPGGQAQRLVQGRDIPHDWWTLFESPALSAVVERALRANATLVAAQQALRQAMELVSAQRGLFFPTLQGSFTPSYQRTSATLAPPLTDPNQFTYTLYTAQVSVGFTPDVFGSNRRQVESLLGQAEAQRFQLEAAYVTLASNVVAVAVQEVSLREQISATREIISISTRSLDLVRRQLQLGAVAALDVAGQEAALAQVEQTLPPVQKQLEQNRNLLAALLGRLPSDDPAEHFDLEFGSVSYLALLSARQAYQQTLITRIQAHAGRLADTTALFQSARRRLVEPSVGGADDQRDPRAMRRSPVRYLTLITAACRAADVAMLNPRTDERATCTESLGGAEPLVPEGSLRRQVHRRGMDQGGRRLIRPCASCALASVSVPAYARRLSGDERTPSHFGSSLRRTLPAIVADRGRPRNQEDAPASWLPQSDAFFEAGYALIAYREGRGSCPCTTTEIGTGGPV